VAAFFCLSWLEDQFRSPDERSDIRDQSRWRSPDVRSSGLQIRPAISVQAAEGIDQRQNRNRHAEQPQQQITSHGRTSSVVSRCSLMPRGPEGFRGVAHTTFVVPANAGTHTPRPMQVAQGETASLTIYGGGYGSLRPVRNCALGRDDSRVSATYLTGRTGAVICSVRSRSVMSTTVSIGAVSS
jgi:hypothetical protein